METIKAHVSRLARKLYSKSQLSHNAHIRQLGQHNPISDTHTHRRPRAVLAYWSYSSDYKLTVQALLELSTPHYRRLSSAGTPRGYSP
jgi:hypothetical protein